VPQKILIVDDNRLILQALAEHLESHGYETLVASNGMEALELVKAEPPDLIIMDVVMPEMDGIEATRLLRQNPMFQDLPIVAFTSQSNQGHVSEIFTDYLIKPFGYDKVIALIQRLLGPLP
jgi:CheY-like chemotaxis protein